MIRRPSTAPRSRLPGAGSHPADRTVEGAQSAALPYWLDPTFIFVAVITVAVLMFWAVSPAAFIEEMRAPKMDATVAIYTYAYGLICILAGLTWARFAAPYPSDLAATRMRQEAIAALAPDIRRIGWASAALAYIAYAYLFGTSGLSLSSVLNTLRGEQGAVYEMKASLENTSGLTSFVNVAPYWFVHAGYKRLVMGRKLTFGELTTTGLLFLFTVFRGFATNERRAIIDLLIPFAVVVLFMRPRWPGFIRSFLVLGPIIGPLFLFGLFYSTEYFRTWLPYYEKVSTLSYNEWVLIRLSGYYTTSINNGLAVLEYNPDTYGYYFLNGVYRMPVINAIFGLNALRAEAVYNFTLMLVANLNPEFNNQGGIIVPIFELGYVAGGFMLVVFGLLCGLCYGLARRGRLHGLMLYPSFVLAGLEAARLWAIASSAAVLAYLFLGAMFFYLRRSGAQAPRAAGPARKSR